MPKDSVNPEDEYFHREDQERLRKIKEQMEAQRAEAERQAQKELHHLHCGKCGAKMTTRVFRGVEIEVCPDCGAVLLDPGELETLVGKDEGQGGLTSFISDFFTFARKKG